MKAMNPRTECRKLAQLLREKAMAFEDAETRAEYAYLVRGFLRLARQFEQDSETKPLASTPTRASSCQKLPEIFLDDWKGDKKRGRSQPQGSATPILVSPCPCTPGGLGQIFLPLVAPLGL
jgi:hypothetical protein